MIATFFVMAVIYLLLNAQFIAVAQVMVYAGAIMMLILFVIMLVHMETGGESDAGAARRSQGDADRRGADHGRSCWPSCSSGRSSTR